MTALVPIDLERATGHTVWVLRLCRDFTNIGVTARFNEVLAISDRLDRGPVEASNRDTRRILNIVSKPGRRSQFVARPIDEAGKPVVGMFGGNYVDSSDARFREAFGGPVPVHDRFEPMPEVPIDDPSPIVKRITEDLSILAPEQRAVVLLDLLTGQAWRCER